MRWIGFTIGLLGLVRVSGALPLDTLFHAPVPVWNRLGLSVDRQQERTSLRAHSTFQDSAGSGLLEVWDSALGRGDQSETWAAEGAAMVSWSRDSLDVAWRWWGRTSALGAPDPALADHAWLQMGLARWRTGEGPWNLGLLGGGLQESQDPGAASTGLRPGSAPGTRAQAGLAGAEFAWTSSREISGGVDGRILTDLGDGSLRWMNTGISASAKASVSGTGMDSLALVASWDTLRSRSERFSVDRSDGSRQGGVEWSIEAGRSRWTVAGRLFEEIRGDLTRRIQGSDRSGTEGALEFSGPLSWGFSHQHRIASSAVDRIWFLPPTGDSLQDLAQTDQDLRDRDRAVETALSDTLRWNDPDSAWIVSVGLSQSLRQLRHPANRSPASGDRADEDIEIRAVGATVRSSEWGWGAKPLFAVAAIFQDDVYPRAIQSIETFHREETRFSIDAAVPLLDWVRPLGGLWGREQRNRWRFDAARTDGLLEEGWSAGIEWGPRERPWFGLRWLRWKTWSGDLAGDAFAPDRIQDDWAPEFNGSIEVADSLLLRPWGRYQIERVSSWSVSRWTEDMRIENARLGWDLVWNRSGGFVQAKLGRTWMDPGRDSWILGLEAEWSIR